MRKVRQLKHLRISWYFVCRYIEHMKHTETSFNVEMRSVSSSCWEKNKTKQNKTKKQVFLKCPLRLRCVYIWIKKIWIYLMTILFQSIKIPFDYRSLCITMSRTLLKSQQSSRKRKIFSKVLLLLLSLCELFILPKIPCKIVLKVKMLKKCEIKLTLPLNKYWNYDIILGAEKIIKKVPTKGKDTLSYS